MCPWPDRRFHNRIEREASQALGEKWDAKGLLSGSTASGGLVPPPEEDDGGRERQPLQEFDRHGFVRLAGAYRNYHRFLLADDDE